MHADMLGDLVWAIGGQPVGFETTSREGRSLLTFSRNASGIPRRRRRRVLADVKTVGERAHLLKVGETGILRVGAAATRA
jgi:hypothetical protein